MGSPNPELNHAAMRTCCDLIVKHKALSISDLVVMASIGDAIARRSVALGVELGYLVEGPKPARLGKGNRRKTYLRTKKRFPREAVTVEEPVIISRSEFVPHRDWAVAALFGPYETRGAV